MLRGNEIFFELLLTSHAFGIGGEKAQKHLQNEYDPDDTENNGQSLDFSENLAGIMYAVYNIRNRRAYKQDRAENQLEIVKRGDF